MNDTESAADIVVVGCGPVGAAIACLLGARGVRTLVIDRETRILMAPRAISLDNEALRILQSAGLAEGSFPTTAIPFVKMHCPYLGEFSRMNTSGVLDGHPKLVTFYQPDLERALREALARHESVTLRLGTEMLDFAEQDESLVLRLRHADGTEAQIRCRYLVAADGAGSSIRRSIGQEFTGRTFAEDWLVVDAICPETAFDHVEFICDPKRPTPHMVAPGGRVRWEFMLARGETIETLERDDGIAKLLAPWCGPGEATIERKVVYRFHARSCAAYRRGRVFLAGDAAHITPPFIGQGLVSGLRDAANLSWKLAWVVAGRADPAILDSYDRERRPHALRMIRLARWMGRLVMPRSRVAAIVVHGAAAALRRVPRLRPLLEELEIKPKNAFAAGLFAKGRGRLRRGCVLPQGLVRDAHGAVLPSDDALGPDLVLLGFGRDPARHLPPDLARRWAERGGSVVVLRQRGKPAESARSFEALDNALLGDGAPHGWCAVVRPDRAVMTDGPVAEAARLVAQALALLGAPAAA